VQIPPNCHCQHSVSNLPVGDMLRDIVKYIRSSQRELTETREQFQLQWRQAQARLVQASQLKAHHKRANKVSILQYSSISLCKHIFYIQSLHFYCDCETLIPIIKVGAIGDHNNSAQGNAPPLVWQRRRV